MDCTVQSSASDHTLQANQTVGPSQSQTVAKALNIFHPICPKKPTNQGEGWSPVTKFGHLSFNRVNCGQLLQLFRLNTGLTFFQLEET